RSGRRRDRAQRVRRIPAAPGTPGTPQADRDQGYGCPDGASARRNRGLGPKDDLLLEPSVERTYLAANTAGHVPQAATTTADKDKVARLPTRSSHEAMGRRNQGG